MKPLKLQRIIRGISFRLKRAFKGDPNQFLRKCKGVIHVGANDGGERDLYARYGFDVLWVEALPNVYQQLSENLRGYPKQSAVNGLLTDTEGQVYNFNVSNNSGISSSIYDFKDHETHQ